MQQARCKECREPVLWVTMTSGNRMPLDPHPIATGNVYAGSDGLGHVVSKKAPAPPGAELYVSHFASCHGAAHFRRR